MFLFFSPTPEFACSDASDAPYVANDCSGECVRFREHAISQEAARMLLTAVVSEAAGALKAQVKEKVVHDGHRRNISFDNDILSCWHAKRWQLFRG